MCQNITKLCRYRIWLAYACICYHIELSCTLKKNKHADIARSLTQLACDHHGPDHDLSVYKTTGGPIKHQEETWRFLSKHMKNGKQSFRWFEDPQKVNKNMLGGAYPMCSSLRRANLFAFFRPEPVGPPWTVDAAAPVKHLREGPISCTCRKSNREPTNVQSI